MKSNPASTGFNTIRNVANNKIVQIGAVGVAFYVLYSSVHPFSSHTEINQGKSYVRAHVAKGDIQPLTLDAKSIMFAHANANVRTEDSETVNTYIAGKHTFLLPGTGQIAGLRAATKTITYIPETASSIARNNKRVTIDPTKIEFDTTYIENETTESNSLPWGTSLGAGESQFSNGLTDGYVPLETNTVKDRFTDLDRYIREATANDVQNNCGAEAWGQTKQAITTAYQIEANKVGRKSVTVRFLPGQPNFVGPYPNAVAPVNIHDQNITNLDCQVAPNAFQIAKSFNAYHPTQLMPATEAAGN